MKKLKDILKNVDLVEIIGSKEVKIREIKFDSRSVKVNDVFVALNGTITDGNKYIEDAIQNGAKTIVTEEKVSRKVENVTYIYVRNCNKALATIASNYYGNPSKDITLIGVTGTNGKTSVVYMLYQLFSRLGYQSGMISTIKNIVGFKHYQSTHTTPDPVSINRLLCKMTQEGCKYCFMEVSSHAIAQNRIYGLDYSAALFTNLSHDHLDYHKTFDNYFSIKKSFFTQLPATSFIITNKDDEFGNKITSESKAMTLTYSLKSNSDFKCKILQKEFKGTLINIDKINVWTQLVGEFNIYNLLLVYATAVSLKIHSQDALVALSKLEPAEGRFEIIKNKKNIIPVVDFAHTHDSLKKVILTIKEICNNKQKLITIIGCGGDRDREKRPKMAYVASSLSSKVIITNDNPRTEDPDQIINDMLSGLPLELKDKILVIKNRKEAIKTAAMIANENDVILLAGKGHEKYQEINGKKIPFSDKEELARAININTT